MNYHEYDTKRRELLHKLARGEENDEILIGELRTLKNQYLCDCRNCIQDLPYECHRINGYSPLKIGFVEKLPNSHVSSEDTYNLESEVRE